MFLLPFLLSKGVLISLSLIVIGSATVYGGVKVNEHRDTQIILQEAKQLSSSGKYQEAINKLAEADHKWAFGETKKEVEGLKEENKTLTQASVNYELGKELFDKGKYKDALEVLKKVDSRNVNYVAAIELIKKSEEAISNLESKNQAKVAGVSTKVKSPDPSDSISEKDLQNPEELTVNIDPLIDCKFKSKSIKMKSSECKTWVDCQVGNEWIPVLSNAQCSKVQYEFHKNDIANLNEYFLKEILGQNYRTSSNGNNNYVPKSYEPDPAVEQARKDEDCRSQKTYLDQQRNSNIESENLSYEQALNATRQNYADNGLYDSGSRYGSEGLITSNHNNRLQSIESQYNSQLSQLRAQGCRF